MKKTNKYAYLYILQCYYPTGWEDLTWCEQKENGGYKELRADAKSYRENERIATRIISRRELINN